MLQNEAFFNKLNELGKKRQAFLFIIDFLGQEPEVFPLDRLPSDIRFSVPGMESPAINTIANPTPHIIKYPVSFDDYQKKFNRVLDHIKAGDTYLINLTQPTRVEMDTSLSELYSIARAPYKLYFRNQFVVFSPESFVQISRNRIMTFPMKGTIDGTIPDAEQILLNDPKEISEHNTIVDLMRNDLSMAASRVNVDRFRYFDTIITHEKKILQVSSQISGLLPDNYHEKIGDILSLLLPAGSISGAPKEKTLEIIVNTEGYERGFYTGVFGVSNGEYLDSAVMIRFVEKFNGNYYFKSGGGITFQSDAGKEYRELIDKVYVPIT